MDAHAIPSRTRGAAGPGAARLWLSALAAVVAAVLTACAVASPAVPTAGSTPAPPPAVSGAGAVGVAIIGFAFTPGTVTIRVGGTVDWTNHDGVAHTATFTGSGIDSGVLPPNQHFSHSFTTPGTYAYICSIHPFMHGTVVVTT